MVSADEAQMRKVKVADLDQASPAGRLVLDRRLRVTINQVCAPRGSGIREPATPDKQSKDCKRHAMANVQWQLEVAWLVAGAHCKAKAPTTRVIGAFQ